MRSLLRLTRLAFFGFFPGGLLFVNVTFAEHLPEPVDHFSRARVIDVKHYELHVTPDFERKKIDGKARILLSPLTSATEIELDADGLAIGGITWEEAGISRPLKYSIKSDSIQITLSRLVKAGEEISISIKYSTFPVAGLYFFGPDAQRKNVYQQAWTQGESRDNHFWFPCYDDPNDKATSELFVTVPKDFLVLSNGSLLESNVKGLVREFHWKQSAPHSTYLISFVAGEFSMYEGKSFQTTPIMIYATPDKIEQAKLSYKHIAPAIEFIEDFTGYKYPWEKYSQAFVANFPFGGMENTSAVTLSQGLLYTEETAKEREGIQAEVIAHEVAHQWFGDLVTPKSWAHIWLNEGFASYFQALISEKLYGHEYFLKRMLAFAEESIKGDHGEPLSLQNYRYVQPIDLFLNHATYNKGAWVLHMLRKSVGDENFKKGVGKYLNEFEFLNSDTQDFQKVMEKVSKQNLDWFFNQWVERGGYPEFKVAWNYDKAKSKVNLEIQQTQKDTLPVFRGSVDVGVATKKGVELRSINFDKRKESYSFDFKEEPITVLFDSGYWLLKDVNFRKKFSELRWQVLNDPDSVGRRFAISQLATSFDLNARSVKLLSRVIRTDKSALVRAKAISVLSKSRSTGAWTVIVSQFEHDTDVTVRKAIIEALGRFSFKEGAALLKEIVENSKMYVADSLLSLGRSHSPTAFRILISNLSRESLNDHIRVASLEGLSALKDRRARKYIKKYLDPAYLPLVRATALKALANLDPDSPDLEGLLLRSTNDKDLFVRQAAFEKLRGIPTRAVRKFLDEAFHGERNYMVARGIRESLEAVRGAIKSEKSEPLLP